VIVPSKSVKNINLGLVFIAGRSMAAILLGQSEELGKAENNTEKQP